MRDNQRFSSHERSGGDALIMVDGAILAWKTGIAVSSHRLEYTSWVLDEPGILYRDIRSVFVLIVLGRLANEARRTGGMPKTESPGVG